MGTVWKGLADLGAFSTRMASAEPGEPLVPSGSGVVAEVGAIGDLEAGDEGPAVGAELTVVFGVEPDVGRPGAIR